MCKLPNQQFAGAPPSPPLGNQATLPPHGRRTCMPQRCSCLEPPLCGTMIAVCSVVLPYTSCSLSSVGWLLTSRFASRRSAGGDSRSMPPISHLDRRWAALHVACSAAPLSLVVL
jgi:hypothetical protein